MAKMIKINCSNCNQEFEKKQSRLKYAKNHYCSRTCVDLHKKKTMKGSANPAYGTRHTEEWKATRSREMKKTWEDKDYVKKVMEARKKYNETSEHFFGWSPEAREKRKQTNLEKFGYEHIWSSPEQREKCEKTTFDRYGKKSLQIARESITEETYEKRRRTLIETMTGQDYEIYQKTLTDLQKYVKNVRRLSEQQPLHLLENYEKRGHFTTKEDPYHLDHHIPIVWGFYNGVPEEVIADISNLRFIPARENCSKGSTHPNNFYQ